MSLEDLRHQLSRPFDPDHVSELDDADIKVAAIRLQGFLRALPNELGDKLFGDAALMILLELLIAELDRRRLPIKNVCIGSGVPQSTALRYIEHLEAAKLIKRHANPFDRRSAHIALTPVAAHNLRAILEKLFPAPLHS